MTVFVLLLLSLSACGGGGGSATSSNQPAAIHTLAYVVDECRQNGTDYYERAALVIRDGERDPVTVAEIPELGPVKAARDFCRDRGLERFGYNSVEYGSGFTRLGVSPDGSMVVFQQSDAFSRLFHNFLTPEQQGLFVVRADGTGLRRLGPPSRQPPFSQSGNYLVPFIAVSPDGRTIALPDKGPSLAGKEASQLVTVDLVTGARTQLTHFEPVQQWPFLPPLFDPVFLDKQTIEFSTSDVEHPTRNGYTVKIDGSELKMVPPVVAAPGAQIVPIFAITGNHPAAFPVPIGGANEIFLLDGGNLLQLTDFGLGDTGVEGVLVSREGDHVFFMAAADPLGTNPFANCQLFSIDRTGADLRQLTNFNTGTPSEIRCTFDTDTRGCTSVLPAQDATTATLLLYSGCDPLGTNPSGAQLFALRPGGSGLRQLTNLRGLFTDADGFEHAELPGPLAYGPYVAGGTNE